MPFVPGLQGLALGLIVFVLGLILWIGTVFMAGEVAWLFVIIAMVGLVVAILAPVWYWIVSPLRAFATEH